MVMIGLLDEEFKGSEKRKNISGLFFPDDIGNPPFTWTGIKLDAFIHPGMIYGIQ